MIYRMGAALTSLLGLFVSAYLYLYKIGRIGTLACGSGGCETVQSSSWSRFLGVDVALIGGAATAVAAGTLWWLDHGATSRSHEKRATTVTPIVSQGFVGGAAQVSF